MDALKSLVQPLMGGSSVVDGMKLVVLGGTVETARRVSSSAWSHFVNSFFLTAHFCEEEHPYDWLILWLSRRPEWQRSREFETTTRGAAGSGSSNAFSPADKEWEEAEREWEAAERAAGGTTAGGLAGGSSSADGDDDGEEVGTGIEKPRTRIVFQPTYDTTHTIYYRGHWLRVKRGRKLETGSEMISISVVARSNTILKQLVLQAKKEYEAECIHRIQIYFADAHGSWRWTDSRHKRPMSSIVLNPGVKEMLLDDARDFLKSEKWYADRGIPFRRGYLLYGVPGSGKSSLIHALAGHLQLDIYVVSLSASWISDSTLTSLMGRVPARCVVLLEDLDAAFTRSTSRDDDDLAEGSNNNSGSSGNNNGKSGGGGGAEQGPQLLESSSGGFGSSFGMGRRKYRNRDHLSDVNTLSLSGLLNALDGVAAAEGRLLFATTNHLERLDPALSRPGRMDVWVEFKNASRWQAEALFRNFFPCEDEDDEEEVAVEGEAKVDVDVKKVPASVYVPSNEAASPSPTSTSSLWSLASSATSLLSGSSMSASTSTSTLPPPPTESGSPISASKSSATSAASKSKKFGASNTAYLPPPPADSVLKTKHSAAPLDKKTLAVLAKEFADGVPEEEFSVASLQGYLLKHKAQPESAASGVADWVISERVMREKLAREKEAREAREKALREKRRKEALEKAQEKKVQEQKELELEKVKARLAEKEKEEELEKMRKTLREKEEEEKKRKENEGKEEDKKEDKKEEVKEDKKEEVKKDKEEDKDEDKENISESSTTSSTWGEALV